MTKEKELKLASEGVKIGEDAKKRVAAIDAETKILLKNAENNDASNRVEVQDNMDEETNFHMQLLESPEFPAFMEKWYSDHTTDAYKYTRGKFEDAWIAHCKSIQDGAEPLTHRPGLTCGRYDSATKTWVTDDTLILPKQDDEKSKLSAGRFNRDTNTWETEKHIEKDSASGLTSGRWNPDKKVWER